MYVLFKLSQYVKGMGIFVKFGYFYDAHSPNMWSKKQVSIFKKKFS